MLRNQGKNKPIIKFFIPASQTQQQTRLIHVQNHVLFNKNTAIFRQGKIMGKLFGDRVSGSKKRWFPSTESSQPGGNSVMFKQSQFGKKPNGGGKNATRRMTVLNKLFMKHVTDLMATGEISETILGKGLQVSRVKISQDFAYVNVFWLSTGEPGKDALLEHELQRCSGLLRHELSQLGLMGVVPRIKFVKDKLYTNMNQVEALLRNMDFGAEEEDDDNEGKEDIDYLNKHAAETMKQEFYGAVNVENKPKVVEIKEEHQENLVHLPEIDANVPEMRHDVLGLDHKGIMLKILTKMRKSKQAWDQHLQNQSVELDQTTSSAIPSTSFEQLNKINEKLAKAAANSEKFEAFLAKRKERRNTPERKKFRESDHQIYDEHAGEQIDYANLVLSSRQRQLYEAEDFLPEEEVENRKHK
ncbi:hypothetical protein FF38_04159 [Lucilia cuprina]|uniref:Ribosome-binding factor A, mitochondrial n=1 Tax=Lucilia cuprina TaxID=7375 RepID=A0A0L0C524_LUCCU|nr:hypothetical protein FF38_04159 [Lucilia cuprina]